MNTNTCLLYSKTTQKLSIRDRVLAALDQDNDIPSFAGPVRRLMEAIQKGDTHLGTIAEITRLDPGITGRLLNLASSPSFGGQDIKSIDEALMLIGVNEVHRIVTATLLVKAFSHYRAKVDWDVFWLHCILVARLTERLVDVFVPTDGREYLSGLLHDVGKIFVGHHFPKEYELVVLRADLAKKGAYEAEMELLDITHSEIASHLCERWRLHPDIIHSIRFHHELETVLSPDTEDSETQPVLILCLSIANRLANSCHESILGSSNQEKVILEELPEWKRLQKVQMRKQLRLDVPSELQRTRDIVASIRTAPRVRSFSTKKV